MRHLSRVVKNVLGNGLGVAFPQVQPMFPTTLPTQPVQSSEPAYARTVRNAILGRGTLPPNIVLEPGINRATECFEVGPEGGAPQFTSEDAEIYTNGQAGCVQLTRYVCCETVGDQTRCSRRSWGKYVECGPGAKPGIRTY